MAKFALLIGVSEYGAGLDPLPECTQDIYAMQRVLMNPEMGGFMATNITILENPNKQEMESKIYQLFDNREKDDLLLFYFSGHGIKDDHNNKLYLTNCDTYKKEDGDFYEPSGLAAAYIHQIPSKSESQVFILDCCYSGAFATDMKVKSSNTINWVNDIGGKGRAILTSSTASETSLGAKNSTSGLSIYTHYLVEGIETGAADIDEDGSIEVAELHEYAAKRVKEAFPSMTPKFYPVEEGFKIILAKSSTENPKLKYRKEVKNLISLGKLDSVFGKALLKSKQNDWGLSDEAAKLIQDELLHDHRQYNHRLEEYERLFRQSIQEKDDIYSQTAKNIRQEFQLYYKLKDEDVIKIDRRVLGYRRIVIPRRNFIKWAGFGGLSLFITVLLSQINPIERARKIFSALFSPGSNPTDRTGSYTSMPNEVDVKKLNISDSEFGNKIISYMNFKEYEISSEDKEYNIIYINDIDNKGNISNRKNDYYHDSRIVIEFINGSPEIVNNWLATIKPGQYWQKHPLNQKGAARIAFGQYKNVWRVGLHTGPSGNSTHEGLIQIGNVSIYRDINRDGKRYGDFIETGEFGINHHQGTGNQERIIGRESAGCLVGWNPSEHREFMELIKGDYRYQKNPDYLFTTTVIDGADLLASISSSNYQKY